MGMQRRGEEGAMWAGEKRDPEKTKRAARWDGNNNTAGDKQRHEKDAF